LPGARLLVISLAEISRAFATVCDKADAGIHGAVHQSAQQTADQLLKNPVHNTLILK
jgi:hypothetical protein